MKEVNRARRWTLAGGAAAVAAASALALSRSAHAMGGPGMRHGMGPWGHGFGGDPETAGRRIEAMVAWMLADIDATPEQKAKIAAIIKRSTTDLAPLRKQHMEARKQSVALLGAPTIDRAKLETLRVQQLQLGDTTSRLMLQAFVDGAEVLTPEQRAKLATKWRQRRQPRQT